MSDTETSVYLSGANVHVTTVGIQGPPGSSSLRTVTMPWAAAMTINWGNYDLVRVVLGGDTTFTFAGASNGQRLILEVEQDDTGSRLVTLPDDVRTSASIPALVLSTAAGATDRIGFIFSSASSTYDLMAYARGF